MSGATNDEVLALILDGERQAATDLVAQWAETHDYERVVTDILEPVLTTIGDRWATSGELSLGEGFVAAKACEEIDRRGLTGQIQLAVGGAVFVQRPELVGELGGDGTARNALEAPALMDRLLTQARRERPRHE